MFFTATGILDRDDSEYDNGYRVCPNCETCFVDWEDTGICPECGAYIYE